MRRCPGGEIGRRKGLKIPRMKIRAGSSPAPGTNSTVFQTAKLMIGGTPGILSPVIESTQHFESGKNPFIL